jgi:alpha-tubulin suppressor-like RCC1 family protein
MPEIKISALGTTPTTPTGTEVFAVVQGSTTYKTDINSLKTALVDNLSVGAPTWDVNGNLTAGFDIIAGGNHDGRVGLTINDGYGNANLTFNHTDGIPDRSGSSARIAVNVDSSQELMDFQLKSSVTAGTSVALTSVLRLYDDAIELLKPTTCQTPTLGTHVARKDYVDTQVNSRATTSSVTTVSSALSNHISATTAHTKSQVGLSNVNNTTDANKPISTATQTALDGKIGETEINTAHFTFANNALSLNTILEGQIGTGAVTPGKLSTGAPTWTENGALYTNQIIGRETADSLILRADPQAPSEDPDDGGPMIQMFSADHPSAQNQIYLRANYHIFQNKSGALVAQIPPTSTPTQDSHLVRKDYVDSLIPKNGFKKFGTWSSRNINSSFYRQTFYISQDDKLMTAGYGNGYNMNGESDEYITGYTAPMIPLAKGEYVTEYYYSGNAGPSIYVLTNLKNLYASGYNGYGQLGLGDTTDRQVFTKIPISNVEFFSASHGWGDATHAGATTTDGSLYMWGYGGEGQLGLNSVGTVLSPTKVSGTGPGGIIAKKVFTYSQYSCSYYIDSNRNVRSCGYNQYGNLGTGDFTQRNVFVLPQGGRKADDIQCNSHDERMTTYLVDGTTLWAAGHNGFGQLGRGNTTHSAEFITVPGGISVGSLCVSHFCVFVVQTNGTLRNWGYNIQGQLGVGDTTQRTSPTAPSGSHTGVIKVISHDNYTSSWFLKSDGSIYSTGYNGYGQLGHGATASRNTYKKVQMDNNLEFKDIESFGHSSSSQLLAVDKFNGLWGCGYNAQWSLGLNHSHTYKTVLTQLHTPS